MRLQITHLNAPWPCGAVVGDVLDLSEVPAWAAGKCVNAGDDADVTIGALLNDEGGDTATGDGTGEVLPPVDSGEGEGTGQPLPVIDDEPVKAKGKHK